MTCSCCPLLELEPAAPRCQMYPVCCYEPGDI